MSKNVVFSASKLWSNLLAAMEEKNACTFKDNVTPGSGPATEWGSQPREDSILELLGCLETLLQTSTLPEDGVRF